MNKFKGIILAVFVSTGLWGCGIVLVAWIATYR